MQVYAGTFLVSFAMLVFEITLTRLLSVITWYHLAFFAVSTAMLGMTAGATTVYLRPGAFELRRVDHNIALACLGCALVIPVSLVLLCLTPMNLPSRVMDLLALFQATVACALPFYFAGIAITAVLTRRQLPIGRIYGADLLGASLGCLFVLLGLDVMDAPSLILLCSPIAALAGLFFCWREPSRGLRRGSLWLLGFGLLLVSANLVVPSGVEPAVVKGFIDSPADRLLVRWNSFSRVVVTRELVTRPQFWSSSAKAPFDEELPQHWMNIDGDAATVVRRFASLDDIRHLRFDLTNLAYFLRPTGTACVIGVGGGRDVQSAIVFGQSHVTGIDVNPIFIDLLTTEFADFAGLTGRPDVTLVADDARAYLSRTQGNYSIIQMALIDTWAATGAGAFTLSENGLYTLQAWSTILDDLADDGVFTVSRWYDPESPGETGRMLSLAVAALLRAGATEPSLHLAMATHGRLATLVLCRRPLSGRDLTVLRETCVDLGYNLPVSPGVPPDNHTLRAILGARSIDGLHAAIADADLNYEPPTDDNPYFFNMIRLNRLTSTPWSSSGVFKGNRYATLTLLALILCLTVLTAATVVVPLLARGSTALPSPPPSWSGAAYFSLIGAGFMFVEIALIQRLSVFLGHPVYALGVLLLTIIASAGVGSLLSERLPLTRRPWVFVYPLVVTAVILGTRFAIPSLAASMVASPMLAKILAAIGALAPVGLCLGVCFPTGMRLVTRAEGSETPWYWALNGVFGVLCSAIAVLVSITYGISVTMNVGALCYGLLLVCLPDMSARAAGAPAGGVAVNGT